MKTSKPLLLAAALAGIATVATTSGCCHDEKCESCEKGSCKAQGSCKAKASCQAKESCKAATK